MTAIFRQCRPDNYDEVLGQDAVVKQLRDMAARDSIPQVSLFVGPSGSGKTTLARLAARDTGCNMEAANFEELNCADVRGIDTVREIRNVIPIRPLGGKARVWILDEVIQLPTATQQAFLKELEELPKHVFIFLCSTQWDKLIAAFLSRCVIFELLPLAETTIKRIVKKAVRRLSLEVADEYIDLIARAADGNARTALQMLEVVVACGGDDNAVKAAVESFRLAPVADFVGKLLFQKKPWLELIPAIKDVKDSEAEGLRRQILAYARAVLLNPNKWANRPLAAFIISVFRDPWTQCGAAGLAESCWVVWQKKSELLTGKGE